VNTKADEEHPWNMVDCIVTVNMTVLSTFGEKFQDDLEQNSDHNKEPNVVIVAFVNVRQQVHHG
jgi:hypothetical protein